jgi:hypothetical protein
MNKLFSLFLLCATASTQALAAEIGVQGRTYSATQCAYYSGSMGDLKFTYSDPLPAGARVVMRYGFHNNFVKGDAADWVAQAEAEMSATGPNAWSASLDRVALDARGGFYYDRVEFVFHVILANGNSFFDNGGSITGYYAADLPQRTCDLGQLEPLPIATVKK